MGTQTHRHEFLAQDLVSKQSEESRSGWFDDKHSVSHCGHALLEYAGFHTPFLFQPHILHSRTLMASDASER